MIEESVLAQQSGLPREVFRQGRPDAVKAIPGQPVRWPEEAARGFLLSLGLDAVSEELFDMIQREARREVLEVVVRRIPRNPMLLICEDAAGTEVRVRVRRNALFVPGMRVPVRVRVGQDVADLARALPRRKGRW